MKAEWDRLEGSETKDKGQKGMEKDMEDIHV